FGVEGHPPTELPQFLALVHPEDRPRVGALVEQTIGSLLTGTLVIEHRVLRPDRGVRIVKCMGNIVRDAAGHAIKVLGSVQDMTEIKEAVAALRDSEERYRMLFESNPHPMWVYERDTLRFLAVNEAAVRRYGYSRQEFLNMTIEDIRPPEDRAAVRMSAANTK